MALLAQIVTDRGRGDARRSSRRALRLRIVASSAENSADALIQNLSQEGLLLETAISLKVGDRVNVELPRSRGAAAIVMWSRDNLYGCKFEREISRATVSAALLLSPAKLPKLSVGELIAQVETAAENVVRIEPAPRRTPDRARLLLAVALLVSLMVVALFIWALLMLPLAAS